MSYEDKIVVLFKVVPFLFILIVILSLTCI